MAKVVQRIGVVLVSSLATVPSILAAQDAKQPKPVQFTAELGFVNAAGNSEVTTFNLGDKLTLRAGHWEHRQTFGSLYGTTGGVESTNMIYVNWRSNFNLSERASVFGYAGFDRNRFAGIAHRFEESIGLSWKIIVDGGQNWTLEAGAGVTQELGDDGERRGFSSARTATEYRKNFSEASYVYQKLEYLPNLEMQADYRLNTETGVVAPLSTHLALKVDYSMRYANIPQPDRRKSDRVLTTGLQLNF